MSNRGRWDNWYVGLRRNDPQPYGNSDSYQILADWMAGCDTVEDWGCGKGWMRQFVPDTVAYIGVDGSHTPFADIIVDLRHYRPDPKPCGIMIRHVLEHDHHWEMILANAVASARQRLGIALFTPMQDQTRVIDHTEVVDVPDIGFAESDLVELFADHDWTRIDLPASPTKYGTETVYLIDIRRGDQ